MKKKNVRAIGYDISTTALSVVGKTGDGEEVFISIPMRGATTWCGQPAFDLNELPGLFTEALEAIKARGFEFASDGVISGSVRQHDMVVLGTDGRFLLPALSWQCNAATEEVKKLKEQGTEDIVGRLEPRLLLPKLLWALEQNPSLSTEIGTIMTTGDFIAMQLTGAKTLCSSEALSNGLLNQRTRTFPRELINAISDQSSYWFPRVVQSGRVIQLLGYSSRRSADWDPVRSLLPSWCVVAGLGDNHAGAVGSGLVGRDTIVISAGTSGTVTRAVKPGTATTGAPLQFEYYDDTLLLSMMPDCASWYDRFVNQFAEGLGYAEINTFASAASDDFLHPYPKTPDEPFEKWFLKRSFGVQARTMQISIAHYLNEHFLEMLRAVGGGDHFIQRTVLTGGLTRSQFFCQALKAEIRSTGCFTGKVLVSNRVGPLANQAATLGALINAMVGGGHYQSLEAAAKDLCPSREI